MKKRILLIAVAAVLAVFAVGCSVSVSTAKIEDAIMTTSIDAEGKPGDEVVSFPADAAVLYTSAKLMNAPDNTQIRIEWTYVTGNQLIDSIVLDSGNIASRYIYSNLEPTQALPEGDYQVQYFVDSREEPDATVKFVVVAAENKTTDANLPYLEDTHMTSGIDATGMPIDTVTSVASSGTWYVSSILRDAQADTMIYYVWYDTNGNRIDQVEFDPQGATDVYIFGSFALTSIAPEGQYRVEVYINDATAPAAYVDFNVNNIVSDNAASDVKMAIYKQTEGGFSIRYPESWEMQEFTDSMLAWFYPAEYAIDGESDINNVFVVAVKGSAAGYTTETALKSWIDETVAENHENYTYVDQSIDNVNGRDIASYAYQWTKDGYSLSTIDFIIVDGDNLYAITFTATNDAFETLYPYVEQMVLSFQIL
ncbi:MAG: PsbP-related protein [Christensenella sp.]|nr:PsbP-related protein [Christensenella sp.]